MTTHAGRNPEYWRPRVLLRHGVELADGRSGCSTRILDVEDNELAFFVQPSAAGTSGLLTCHLSGWLRDDYRIEPVRADVESVSLARLLLPTVEGALRESRVNGTLAVLTYAEVGAAIHDPGRLKHFDGEDDGRAFFGLIEVRFGRRPNAERTDEIWEEVCRLTRHQPTKFSQHESLHLMQLAERNVLSLRKTLPGPSDAILAHLDFDV